MKLHYEKDAEAFPATAYEIAGQPAVAWCALGWETKPDEDTEWTGIENRTGKVVCVMVGDDQRFTFDPDDLSPLEEGDFCAGCGQLGHC